MRTKSGMMAFFFALQLIGCAENDACVGSDCGVDASDTDGGEASDPTQTEPNDRTETSICDETHEDWTVGLQSCSPDSQPGYTLFAPMRSTSTYLIDLWGEKVHEWTSTYKPGLSVYLEDDGSILRATTVPRSAHSNQFDAGGLAGRVEHVSWDSELLWSYQYASTNHISHHDVERLPNGNVLMIAFEVKTEEEALAAGRDYNLLRDGELWPDHIIEVRPDGPDGGEIVWEWHVWDHLIQDFDETKANYGVVADHPGKMNINYVGGGRGVGGADWLHINSIDYNAELDQILLSAHNTNEIYIIDHNTTTEEAAGPAGDFLYRWGNPQAYGRGGPGEQQLFVQHDARWIEDGKPGEGNILIFNNGGSSSATYTTVDEIVPPYDSEGGYFLDESGHFGPSEALWRHGLMESERFYSRNISGAHRLTNGNTLICDGPHGRFFEVQPDGTIVWEYINPVINDGIVVQGESVPTTQNGQRNPVFRATRIEPTHSALSGRELMPQGYIETSP